MSGRTVAPVPRIEQAIFLIRGERIILDADLAALYGVTTKALNQAVRRNLDRFQPDFAFRLAHRERREVVTNCDHLRRLRYSRLPPLAFTEHGAIMAANVMKSPRAVEMSVLVVRAFVGLRRFLDTHSQLARKLGELERRVAGHSVAIRSLVGAIRQLMTPSPADRARIGFRTR